MGMIRGHIITCTQQHIVGGGVPAQDANTFGVTLQFDNRICEWRGQPAVRDLPNLITTETMSTLHLLTHITIQLCVMLWGKQREFIVALFNNSFKNPKDIYLFNILLNLDSILIF